MIKNSVLIMVAFLVTASLHAADTDAVHASTFITFGMGVSIAVFVLVVIGLVTLLRKRSQRRRLNGLSHLL